MIGKPFGVALNRALRQPGLQAPLLALGIVVFVLGIFGMVPDPQKSVSKLAPGPVTDPQLLAPQLLGTQQLEVRVFSEARALVMDAGVISNSPKLPVENAVVSLFFHREDGTYAPLAQQVTDAKGRVHLEGLPEGAAWLIVHAEGFGRGLTSVALGTQNQTEVRLWPERALNVHVKDEAGHPIQAATVLVKEASPVPHGALTGEQGEAHFSSLNSSPWTVQVFARGFEAVTRHEVEKDLDVVMQRLSTLKVRVVDSKDQPQPDATVLIVGANLWPARQTQTQADGRVQIGGLYPGRYELKASKGKLTTSVASAVTLDRAEVRELVLKLQPGRFVSLLVEHKTLGYPEPIAEAHAVLADYGVSAFPLAGVTDAEGKLTLGPVGTGSMVASVTAKGFMGSSVINVPEDLVGPLRVVLHKGATLRGIVTDATGWPIDGASVEVIGTDLEGLPIDETPLRSAYRNAHFAQALEPLTVIAAGELGVTQGNIPSVSDAISGEVAPSSSFAELPEDYVPWITDFQGRFKATPVSAGRLRVLVRHPAYVEGLSEEVRVGWGGEVSVKVVLAEGAELTGRVVNEDGRPVPGVRVRVSATRGSFERSVLCGWDGRFAFSAVPKDVVVSLARPEEITRFATRKPLSLRAGKTKDVELVLPDRRADARYVVVDERDQPVELAQVSVSSLNPEIPLRETRFTDSSGAVEFEDLAGLRVRVNVSFVGRVPLSVELTAPTDREFQLVPGVLVRGRVTAVRGRRVVEGARVELIGGDQRRWSSTNALGEYEFRNVPQGKAEIRTTFADYATKVVTVQIEDTGFVDRAFEPPDINLEEASRVRGQVLNPAGEAVAGARISLSFIPTYSTQGRLPAGVVLSDESGHFDLGGVAGGSVTIYAYHPRWGRTQKTIELEEGQELDGLELQLAPGTEQESDLNVLGGGVAVTLGERDTRRGTQVVIVHVAPGGEAFRAGLLADDILLSVDGTRVSTMREARQSLNGRPGDDVVVGIRRNGQELSFRVRRERVTH